MPLPSMSPHKPAAQTPLLQTNPLAQAPELMQTPPAGTEFSGTQAPLLQRILPPKEGLLMQAPSVLQGTQFPELVSHWGVLASAHWAWEVQPVLTQAAPGVGQLQPDSMLHVAEQPSAAAALPSSQASAPLMILSPHLDPTRFNT